MNPPALRTHKRSEANCGNLSVLGCWIHGPVVLAGSSIILSSLKINGTKGWLQTPAAAVGG